MFALTETQRFYIYSEATDMRKSFNALSGLVRSKLKQNPLSGNVFIFVNKRKNLMKLLHWQEGGFVLYYKRLEKGQFEINFSSESESKIEISHAQLAMIIAGISTRNITKLKRFRKEEFML
jgi:transposase